MAPRCTVVICLLLAAACRRTPEKPATARVVPATGAQIPHVQPAAAGSVLADRFVFQLAVFHPRRPRVEARAVAERLVRAAGMQVIEALPEKPPDGPVVRVRAPQIARYEPPKAEEMEYAAVGLSPAQQREVARARTVTVLDFVGPPRAALTTYRQALELAGELRRIIGGYLWDDETSHIFTGESWRKRLEGWEGGLPSVVPHIVIGWKREDALTHLATHGMTKFGLPEIVVRDFPASDRGAMASVIDLVCQTLLERPTLDAAGTLTISLDGSRHSGFRRWLSEDVYPNAQRRATVHLTRVPPAAGKSTTGPLELVFPGEEAELHVRQEQLVADLFGTAPDTPTRIDSSDPTWIAARERAVRALLGHKARFVRGLPAGETLWVRAPFATPKPPRKEFMWLEVVRWEGRTMRGILRNDPIEVPGLRSGARVEVDEGAVTDYVLHRADGSEEGDGTAKLESEASEAKTTTH